VNPQQLQEIIAAAKAKIAARKIQAEAKTATEPATEPQWSWNQEQTDAINNFLFGRSFVLIGAAGTGKTTTLRGSLSALLEQNRLPMLAKGTANLATGSVGAVLVSYTRIAVRNIAKQMPKDLQSHCMTIHKLIEFAPTKVEVTNNEGETVESMRFLPQRNAQNPLPADLRLIVVDEASMVSLELMQQLVDALPNPAAVQFVFLGDLNQLPPVYGLPILAKKLIELPIVELTRIYRQALESPIIALATAVRTNNFTDFNEHVRNLWETDAPKDFDARNITQKVTINRPGRGKITIQPWKKRTETDTGLSYMKGQAAAWATSGEFNWQEDLILCPWGKSFGTKELNRAVAQALGKQQDAEVFEIIAGFEKYYYAVGDKLMVDKRDVLITDIQPNPKYFGKVPQPASKTLDRWGFNPVKQKGLAAIDTMSLEHLMENLADISDRTAQASHTVYYRRLDDETATGSISKAAEFNASDFAYCLTVHKAQGSERRKIFFLSHYCHAISLFRELVYTAVTRAAEELHIVMTPKMLATSAGKPRIKGNTLADKLEFYRGKLEDYENANG
jgi:ATP-dependent exoDNAse (exonuclease V) alpha subunit